jgi:hypothetical protein
VLSVPGADCCNDMGGVLLGDCPCNAGHRLIPGAMNRSCVGSQYNVRSSLAKKRVTIDYFDESWEYLSDADSHEAVTYFAQAYGKPCAAH